MQTKAISAYLITLILLGGCASAMQASPMVVAPYPKTYTCKMLRDLGKQYKSLPEEVRQMLDDYATERAELAAAHGLKLKCE